MWRTVVLNRRWGAAALFLSFAGCTALSDCKYELGQKIRTSQAWHEFDGCNDQCFTCDYSDGWKKGYYDVLTGGDGRPPVVPPKKYWKPPVFTEHDPSKQNDWYTGYQDGASCAKAQPDFHYVPTFMAPSMHPVHFEHEIVEVMPDAGHVTNSASLEPMPEAILQQTAPDAATGANPAASPAAAPVVKPETAPQAPKGEDYEKDPEPAKTQSRADGPSATEKLVSRYRKPSSSHVDQLVRNASHTLPQATDNAD